MHKSRIPTSYYLYGGAVMVVLGLIIFVVSQKSTPETYYTFAQCITEKGAVMYGAWWCPHCQNQKKAFGNAFDDIQYVECSAPGSRTMTDECREAGIEGYPTWEFGDGSRASGEQSFDELSVATGCQIPSE